MIVKLIFGSEQEIFVEPATFYFLFCFLFLHLLFILFLFIHFSFFLHLLFLLRIWHSLHLYLMFFLSIHCFSLSLPFISILLISLALIFLPFAFLSFPFHPLPLYIILFHPILCNFCYIYSLSFSTSVAGDVRFWDPRFSESVKHFETLANMTAFEVHHQAKVIARYLVKYDDNRRLRQ